MSDYHRRGSRFNCVDHEYTIRLDATGLRIARPEREILVAYRGSRPRVRFKAVAT
jgi:hypothetical protein